MDTTYSNWSSFAFCGFVLHRRLTYKKNEMDTQMAINRKALIVTWETDEQDTFWNMYKNEIHPTIKTLHQKGLIDQVFPFKHKPLNYKSSKLGWTNCIVLMLSEAQLDTIIDSTLISVIQQSTLNNNFRALDLFKVQKNLDMFYPKTDGIIRETRMMQIIEYVFSNPDARKDYYEDQYKFSGPAMKDLHSRDKVGRFIGFELEKRITAKENMPEWDVIHIIGFTPWQIIKVIPVFFATWNKHAESVFGNGMTFKKKVSEWNEIRTNVKTYAKQNFEFTMKKN